MLKITFSKYCKQYNETKHLKANSIGHSETEKCFKQNINNYTNFRK